MLDRGSIPSEDAPIDLAYDGSDQSVGITDVVGGNDQVMVYSGSSQGERLWRGATGYVGGPFGLVTETTGSTTIHYRHDPTGNLLAHQQGSNSHFYLRDSIGSIVALVEANGDIAAAFSFDPYGRATTNATVLAEANPWRHAAGCHDTVSGLTKHGTRYVDHATGRWTQPDHWRPEPAYTYTGGNSINRTDRPEHEPCTAVPSAVPGIYGLTHERAAHTSCYETEGDQGLSCLICDARFTFDRRTGLSCLTLANPLTSTTTTSADVVEASVGSGQSVWDRLQ